jgi:hypothetical protein
MIALLLAGLSLGGCAAPASIEPAPIASSGEAVPMPHLRQVGPDDEGREVVLRFGDRLDVVPASRPGGMFTVRLRVLRDTVQPPRA